MKAEVPAAIINEGYAMQRNYQLTGRHMPVLR